MELALASWSEFNIAVAGAGAALGGLLIVAISVNIKQISESPRLAARAGASIAALILGVVAVALGLVPGQPLWAIGLEVLVGTVVVSWVGVRAARTVLEDPSAGEYKRFDRSNIAVFFVPLLAFAIGSIVLLFDSPAGFYFVAFGSLLALVGAVLFSWVALVEILR